jgi:enoyl-CoA hydratase/carnithine racemase
MSNYETLVVDRGGVVVSITLNRPHKKNSISGTMLEEMGASFVGEVQVQRASADSIGEDLRAGVGLGREGEARFAGR